MNTRTILISIAMALVAVPESALADNHGKLWGADGHEQITNVWAFEREVDRTLLMANDGEYGDISDADRYRVEEAGRTIKAILSGRSSNSLSSNERAALADARMVIGSVLQTADKDREVCLPAMITGSRIPRPECLTVEEREDRAYYERERRWPPA